MLCLSKKDIEAIGDAVLMDYAMRFPRRYGNPIDIDFFAEKHLGLDVKYQKLSDNGEVLGLTTYDSVVVDLVVDGKAMEISVSSDTILLDNSLCSSENKYRRRFTIAHECAHQIIADMQEAQTGYSFRREFKVGSKYTYSQFKTAEEWSEWQANYLGASLLMPKFAVLPHIRKGHQVHMFTSYDGSFNNGDYARIKRLADKLCVSVKAMEIRLKDMGFMKYGSAKEFYSEPEVSF